MSLISSLYIGQNGLNASSQELGVVGDNIANANTIGFKAGRASFSDLVGENLVGGGGQLGLGARMNTVQKIFSQGSLLTTQLAGDLAISGPGMFVVRTPDGVAYTRNGQFQTSPDGFLVDLDNNRVQGFAADSSGTVSGSLSDLQVGDASMPAQATTTIGIHGNLDPEAPLAPGGAAFDPANPEATSNFASPSKVVDSLGIVHDVMTYYRQESPGVWSWHSVADGGGLVGGTAGTDQVINEGTLSFDNAGNLLDAQTTLNDFQPANAASPQNLTINFGATIASGATGTDGITAHAGKSTNTLITQDGVEPGVLSNFNVDEGGNIVGSFSNGQSRVLGQIALADFPAPDQLQRAGNNLFLQSGGSGEPNIGTAANGGRGAILGGTLEQSNVDIATELVRMIVVQRGFQANSKTVSTADELLSELIQLKR